MQAAPHGAQNDVLSHQVESRHLLRQGGGRQQAAVHRVNMNGVFALRNKQNVRGKQEAVGRLVSNPSVWTPYLAVSEFLQEGLHHDVALHAHLEPRDLGRNTGVSRGPQRSQELASSDGVNYHRTVLKHGGQREELSGDSAVTGCSTFEEWMF